MRILFVTGHYAFLRNFESVIRQLAQRGHRIHLAAERGDEQKRPHLGGQKLVQSLMKEFPQISRGWTPERKHDPWFVFGMSVRTSLDYLRFLRPEYQQSPSLIRRARDRTSKLVVWLADRRWVRGGTGLRALEWALRSVERAIPSSPDIERFLLDQKPDIILITPLLGLGSPQYDYLKSAKALGMRTVLCVTSWDHLSSKALIRELPDRILVWNELQKSEAVKLHRVPADRVVVTGAQCYDHWFEWQTSTAREEFCSRVGLDSSRSYVLYVCSAFFRWAGDETTFVVNWLRHLREHSDSQLRGVGVLIRPHPARVEEWSNIDLSAWTNVAVWPKVSANPIDAESKSDYYDSIYHSAAIVGVNTSALIEAGIIGRPVYTILDPEVAESQVETLHFHHLLNAGGGLLRAARNFDDHCTQLAQALDGTRDHAEQNRRFVEAFVRPYGLDMPASPRFVDAVEQAPKATPQPTPDSSPLGHTLLRPLLFSLAVVMRETGIVRRRLLKGKRLRTVIRDRLLSETARFLVRNERLHAWMQTDLAASLRGDVPFRYPVAMKGFRGRAMHWLLRKQAVRSFLRKFVVPYLSASTLHTEQTSSVRDSGMELTPDQRVAAQAAPDEGVRDTMPL